MAYILNESTQVARKSYPCDACDIWEFWGGGDKGLGFAAKDILRAAQADGNMILPGQEYIKIVSKDGGNFVLYRARPAMHKLCDEYNLFDNERLIGNVQHSKAKTVYSFDAEEVRAASEGLPKWPPALVKQVSYTEYSRAALHGGLQLFEFHYIYFPVKDWMIREDVIDAILASRGEKGEQLDIFRDGAGASA